MSVAPLAGLTVVEFTHMVMGPAVGAIFASLGAEVIRVEPRGGDPTRALIGSGAGYFPMYNRHKGSVCLDLKSADGLAEATRLAGGADGLIENFRPGALDRLEGTGIPFAPIARPEELFDDPHLNASGGLEAVTLPDGRETLLPALPVAYGAEQPGAPARLPRPGGDHDWGNWMPDKDSNLD